MIRLKTSQGRLWAAFGADGFVVALHSQEDMGRAAVERGIITSGAARNGRQLAKRVSPYKEQPEPFRGVRDLRSDGSLMCQAFKAGKAGDWAEFPNNDKLSFWASVQVREFYSQMEQIDEDRRNIAQLVLLESTDFLKRIIVPVEGHGGVTLSYVCTHLPSIPA